MTSHISVSQVDIREDEEALVLQVLRSGHLAQGPMVAELERQMAQIAGVRHAVAVSSGTTALVCALQALRHLDVIAAGDEVITSAYTFVATLNAALEADLIVRFADIGDDFCMDPESVEHNLTDRSKILMPVHLYGQPADMNALESLAARRDLFIVEDAAQAVGATIGTRPVGSFGIGCFSLYATKNVTSGEGGVLTTDRDDIAHLLKLLRNQGMSSRYQYEVPGHNYRMTDLQAAVAVGQLRRYEANVAARRRNADRLTALLDNVPGVVVPIEKPGRRSVWHQYTIRVTEDCKTSRDRLAVALGEVGIGSGVYYPRPVYDYPCFAGHRNVLHTESSTTSAYSRQVLSLPVHPGVGDEGIDRIGSTIQELLGA